MLEEYKKVCRDIVKFIDKILERREKLVMEELKA